MNMVTIKDAIVEATKELVAESNKQKLSWDSLKDIPFAGQNTKPESGRKTSPSPTTTTTPTNDDLNKCQTYLHVLEQYPAVLKEVLDSPDIAFLVNITALFKDDLEIASLHYFVADLYILLDSWKQESFAPELVDDYYGVRLNSLLKKYQKSVNIQDMKNRGAKVISASQR